MTDITRTPAAVLAVALAVVLAAAGCSGPADSTPAAASASATATTTADDAAGRAACTAAAAAVTDTALTPDRAEQIGRQAATATAPYVRSKGELLADHAELARHATGQPDAAATRARMVAALIDLATECRRAGYGGR